MRHVFAAALAMVMACSAAASETDRLNFVVVLVDDLGWMDVSCQGSDYYKTPNVDRLASEGIRFTNAYAACAVCSPTRAAVQTGRYPGRVGVTDWIRAVFQRGNVGTPDRNPTKYVGNSNRKLLCPPNPYWMEHSELTIPELLGRAGYKSAYIGKWHLGDEAWYPPGQGYTVNKGGCDYGQPPSYFDPFSKPDHKHPMVRAGIPGLPGRKEGQYLTHREAEEAVALIDAWKDEPFFLQIGHYAVHTPIQAIPEVAAKYAQEGKTQINAKYAAMVESFDDSTRDVLAALERNGIADRTVVIFTSDNGGLDNKGNPTDNAPLRSGKGYPYEGGIRVPFLVRWPGQIPAGTVSDAPVCSVDILPTVMEAAGLALPDDREIDGISLVSHMKSGAKQKLDRDELIWHFPHYRHEPGPYSIIRKGDWKLIHFYEGIQELYNLKDDLGEERNLVAEKPELVQQLKQRLMERLQDMSARLPEPNPDFVQR